MKRLTLAGKRISKSGICEISCSEPRNIQLESREPLKNARANETNKVRQTSVTQMPLQYSSPF